MDIQSKGTPTFTHVLRVLPMAKSFPLDVLEQQSPSWPYSTGWTACRGVSLELAVLFRVHCGRTYTIAAEDCKVLTRLQALENMIYALTHFPPLRRLFNCRHSPWHLFFLTSLTSLAIPLFLPVFHYQSQSFAPKLSKAWSPARGRNLTDYQSESDHLGSKDEGKYCNS